MNRVNKRVCYVVPSLSAGGTEKQLVQLVEGLTGDHEITVICTKKTGALVGDVRRAGAYVRELNLLGGWDFRLYRQLRRVFRAHRPDVLHSFLFGFDYHANRAAVDTGVPVVISSRRQLATWRKPRHLRLQRKANRLVDCVLTNSNAVKNYAIEHEGAAPELFRVIPNGVEADHYVTHLERSLLRKRFGLPLRSHVIGIVANFSPVKDYPLFIQIARELLQRRSDVHFLAVGVGDLVEAIEHEASNNGLDGHFTRTRTICEMADLYGALDCFVLCSKSEGFPNVVMEAMAARRPVVAAKVGGIPELIQDGVTGVLIPTRNPGDFADAIEQVLDHPDASQQMGEMAGRFVRENLTVERMVQAHRRLYIELLAEHARQA